ncbi:hypothetical protein Zmor_015337 [Zophobas morio]|uniref:Sodium channel protein Nach n=1 Tax=Zophobas morio TaxID=2755281 RepID=A0AA38M4K5_9CUCU|nr:hypothetical protein Zmor_026592 [Zophobas morio]KAJ3656248.1 hypothetical protein Zmor_015337 [Zophobas morio]
MAIWDKLTRNPTLTTLENTNFPVSKVPFPGVSICNLNKISKKKAEDVAAFISDTTGSALDVVQDYMKTLGSFYDFDDTNIHKQLQFQQILEKFTHVDEFRPVKLMKWLSPTCEDFLLRCSWKNQEVNCSEIFQLRLTFEGYCCVFNYVKETNEVISESFRQNEIMFGEAGLHSGLTVVLNNQLNDYFYTKQASMGANVHIFNPTDYPDKSSGGLSEQLIGISTEFLIQLETITYDAVRDVVYHPVDERKCYFPSEKQTYFGLYSESDCLMDCRMRSMAALCGCVPFMIPQNRTLVCGLSDIQCLSKYRVKWDALAPPDAFIHSKLKREAHYALHCEDRCYSTCTTYTYQIATNPVPIKDP